MNDTKKRRKAKKRRNRRKCEIIALFVMTLIIGK